MRISAALVLAATLTGCDVAADDTATNTPPSARELVDLRSRILAYTRGLRPDDAYTPPGGTTRARLAEGVGRLLDGDESKAQPLLARAGFTLTRLTDTASGRRYDEIAARSGPARRWGRLYLNADSEVRWTAQVPHPVSDRNTELLGVRLLEGVPGGSLVLAGAHRRAGSEGAADVAHREDSVFHAIVVELQKRGVPGVQLHGFAEAPDRPFDAVVSTGAAQNALGETTALADRMEADGLRVCRGWSDRCPLEGTTNVQGRSAQQRHATFVHVELAPGARGNGSDARATTKALSELVTTWTAD